MLLMVVKMFADIKEIASLAFENMIVIVIDNNLAILDGWRTSSRWQGQAVNYPAS